MGIRMTISSDSMLHTGGQPHGTVLLEIDGGPDGTPKTHIILVNRLAAVKTPLHKFAYPAMQEMIMSNNNVVPIN